MVYIILADGFETNEALTCINYLRRAKIDILSAGIDKTSAVSSHNIKVECDTEIDKILLGANDSIILPGGLTGVENIRKSKKANELIKSAFEKDCFICAICAAPTLLAEMGFLKGKKAVCYPDMKSILIQNKAEYSEEKRVEKDGKFITAIAAGASEEFAFEIIKNLKDKESADKVKAAVYAV